jgi:hypothetical protein
MAATTNEFSLIRSLLVGRRRFGAFGATPSACLDSASVACSAILSAGVYG